MCFKIFCNKKDNKDKNYEPILKCPRCNVSMEKIMKEDVIIDVCRKCSGMWLDDKEIEKLVSLAGRLNHKPKEAKNGKKRK